MAAGDRAFYAQYQGMCVGTCGGSIQPGQLILRDEDGWAHQHCAVPSAPVFETGVKVCEICHLTMCEHLEDAVP